MDSVIIISRNKYPDCDAGAIRDTSFAKIYRTLEFNVELYGFGNEETGVVDDGITYKNFIIPRSNIREKFQLSKRYKDVIENKVLNNLMPDRKIGVIHVVDIPAAAMKAVEQFALSNRITLIHDSVEWYSACEYKMGCFAPAYILKNYLNSHVINRNYKVIAISSFLNAHFIKKGIESIRIPVIMDTNIGFKENRKNSEFIDIAYAGNPGKKDSLNDVITAFKKAIFDKHLRIRLHLIGITEKQAIETKLITDNEIRRMNSNIIFYGRVSRSEVIRILSGVHFTILVRPMNERYAKAGFPTKVVESMSLGIPVICNLTSDLSMYLNNNENSVVIEDDSVDAIQKAFERVASITHDQWQIISEKAKKTAANEFDYRNYDKKIEEFISNVSL